MDNEKQTKVDRTSGLSNVVNTAIKSEEFSNTGDISHRIGTNSRCLVVKTVAWKTVKKIVFLVCLIFVVIQSIEFYTIYTGYPTNIVKESAVDKTFKLPAVTICLRNTIATNSFCLYNPNLCEKPNDIKAFCDEHPIYCEGDTSNLTIPKMGYYTEFLNDVEKKTRQYLLNDSLYDPDIISMYRWPPETSLFVYHENRLFKCYSENLHLYQSGLKLETMKIEFNREKHYGYYIAKLYKISLFQPLGLPQMFIGIHSPFIPMNPVVEGHAIKSRYKYIFDVQLEKEEHLLPPPYQTNCKDNGPSEDVRNFTNPNSYQMCLEICESEFSKKARICDRGLTMILSRSDLCFGISGPPPEPSKELKKERLECIRNCQQGCLKLQYKYQVQEINTGQEWGSNFHQCEKYRIHKTTSCSPLWERRTIQSYWWTTWLLAWNLRLHFHRHHREVLPQVCQLENETHKGESAENSYFRKSSLISLYNDSMNRLCPSFTHTTDMLIY